MGWRDYMDDGNQFKPYAVPKTQPNETGWRAYMPKPEYQSAPDKYRQNEMPQQQNQNATFLGGLWQAGVTGTGNLKDNMVWMNEDAQITGKRNLAETLTRISDGNASLGDYVNAGKNALLDFRILLNPRGVAGELSQQVQAHQAEQQQRAQAIDARNNALQAATPHYDNRLANWGYGGLQSFVTNAPAMAASAVARNPMLMLGYGSASTGADKYVEARRGGYNPTQATAIGGAHGAIEGLTEYIPAGKLVGSIGKSTVGKILKDQILSDVPGEIVAAVSQNAIDTQTGLGGQNKGDWRSYLSQLPNTVGQAAVGSIVGSGANAAVAGGINRFAGAQPPVKPAQPFSQQVPQINKSAPLVNAIRNAGGVGRNVVPTTRLTQIDPESRKRLKYNDNALNEFASYTEQKYGLPSGILNAIKNHGERSNSWQVSSKNARGVMQFIGSTAQQYGLNDPSDPVQSIDAAGRYFKDMLKRYNGNIDAAITEYNGGIIQARRVKNGGQPTATETINYLKRVKSGLNGGVHGVDGGYQAQQDSQSFDTQTTQLYAESALQDYQDELQSQLEEMQAAQEKAYADQQDEFDARVSELQDKLDALQGADTEVEVNGKYEPSQWMIQEADSLGATMDKADNQFRDRNRLSSEVQINEMANNLDHRKLMDSPMMDYGAPTLANDGATVIGGNGRIAAIKRAYEQGKANTYREHIKANAGRFGFTPEQVAQYKKPVLTRRFKNFVDVQQAAIASNEGGGLVMSALEQSKVDASRLPPLSSFRLGDDGNLNTPANRKAIRAFVDGFPKNHQASLLDANGMLSQQGLSRLKNAMLYQAYGDSPTLSRLVESNDIESRNVGNAMMQVAGTVADAKSDIVQGHLHDLDISQDIMRAADILEQIKAEGGTIRKYLAQRNLLDEHMTPVSRRVLRFLDKNIRSAKKIRDLINAYYDAVRDVGSPRQADMLGGDVIPTREQLMEKAINDAESGQTDEPNIFEPEPNREATAGHERSAGASVDESGQKSEAGRGDGASAEQSGEQGLSDGGGLQFSKSGQTNNNFDATARKYGGREAYEQAKYNFDATARKYGGREAYEQAKSQGQTELNYHQWVQVRTPEFKAWFGDWENDPDNASKLVNEETGEPLVVYHGTDADFSRFNLNKLGANTIGYASSPELEQTARIGHWFNTSPTGRSPERYGAGYSVDMPVYLRLEAPLTVRSLDELEHMLRGKKGASLRRELESDGYDGVIVESDEEFGGISYIAFRPNHIKSATGNIGTFSVQNDDIRYSRSADTKAKYEQRIDELFAGYRKSHNQSDVSKKTTDRSSVQAIQKAIHDVLMFKTNEPLEQHLPLVRVVQSDSRVGSDVQAMYDPKTKAITLIADNIAAGQERGVFLHEIFHKRGRELMGEHYSALGKSVKAWSTRPSDSIENKIYTEAKRRADESGEKGQRYTDEFIAYAIEEAVNRGVEPSANLKDTGASGFLARVLESFKNVLRRLVGGNPNINAKDLVDMAYGAAGLELAEGGSNRQKRIAQKIQDYSKESVQSDLSEIKKQYAAYKKMIERVELGTPKFPDQNFINADGSINAQKEKQWVRDTADVLGDALGIEVTHSGSKAGASSYMRVGLNDEIRVSTHSKGAFNSQFYYHVQNKKDAERVFKLFKDYDVSQLDNYKKSLNAIETEYPFVKQSSFDKAAEQYSAKNDDIRFSKVPKESIAHEEKIYRNGLGIKVTKSGELAAGKAAYDKLTEVAKSNYSPLSWLKFVSNKPAVFTSIMHDYRAENTKFQRAAQDIANESKSFDAIERKVLKELLTNELEFDTVPPEHIVQVANEIRTLLNNQTDELVANGMLSRESAERWRENYLPRFYDKQADLFGGVKQGLSFIKSARAAMRMGMDGSHLKGRGIFKSVPKGSEAQYEAQGWEVRGQDAKGNPVVWRDYTKAERANMNENQDGIMSFTAGYMQTQADLAKARLFKRISENEELASKTYRQDWVQIPDIPIADTGIRKFGSLGGMFVHPEVHDHMKNEFGFANQGALLKTWRKALGYWKATKTVYNPVAHMNNMVSNVSMLWLAGGNPQDLVRGCRDLIKKQGYYDEAIDAGLIGDGVDSAAIRDMFGGVQNVKERGALMNYLAEKSANWHVLKPLTALKEAAEKAYRTEDEVFKFSLYTQQRNKGMSIENAREYAIQFFFDYADMPQGLRVLRDTSVLPFISYTSKAIPAIMRATLTRPHRMLAWVGAAHAINALSYMVLGSAGDEEEEKKNMPEYRQGAGLWGMPRQIRLPWNDDGKAAFLDITRLIPLGDFTDTTNQQGGLPLPNWMMPNGPVLGAFSVLALNKDPFTGDEFKKSYETFDDTKGRYAKWLLSQWLPSSVAVPFSYHTNNVLDGVKSQFENTWASDALEAIGYTGRKRSGDMVKLDDALRGSIGIKTWSFDPKQQAAKDIRRKQFEAREIKSDMSRTRKDNSLTSEQKADKLNSQRQALERLFATE